MTAYGSDIEVIIPSVHFYLTVVYQVVAMCPSTIVTRDLVHKEPVIWILKRKVKTTLARLKYQNKVPCEPLASLNNKKYHCHHCRDH